MTKQNIRVPYALSVHGEEEIRAVVGVLRGNTALGPKAKEFEQRIAKLFGKKYGVFVNSGSSANLLAMELLQFPKGSEIITPLLTFATTIAPIIQKGYIPVFADVEEGTYNININQIERLITKKTKALMIPSLIGNISDMARLRAIAKKHKLIFIEDSCDTLGARFEGKPTGMFSDITTTSFYGSHIINGAGGGGMILVNNPVWARRLLVLRGWGRQSSLFGESKGSEDIRRRFRAKVGGIPYDAKFIFSEIGYNFLPLELSAAFGLVQLKKLGLFAKRRKENFQRMQKFFRQYNKFFITPRPTPHSATNWLAYPLTIRVSAPFSRIAFMTYLEQHNIQTRPIFTGNLLRQPAFRNIPHRTPLKAYPETEAVMRRGVLIACHQGLTPKHIAHIENTIRGFLKKYL